jgi:hypothetical protein
MSAGRFADSQSRTDCCSFDRRDEIFGFTCGHVDRAGVLQLVALSVGAIERARDADVQAHRVRKCLEDEHPMPLSCGSAIVVRSQGRER